MRPLYFFFKIVISYGISVFFRKLEKVNERKKRRDQSINVVNHASAFMDPWVIAVRQNPIVFFMTRGDIFKPAIKPFLWASHLLPIFRRAEDGVDSQKKNEAVFKKVYDILDSKRSIMIFGEGYTDDVFVRSLKPLKKGPARMAFGKMEIDNWKMDLKIVASGINYTDPNIFRSDVLIANSDPILVKDYKNLYLENPAKAINQLTIDIEKELQKQLTYLEEPTLTPFLDQIQTITKKGMVHKQAPRELSLKERWLYSQNTANKINEDYSEDKPEWKNLKTKLDGYFSKLKTNHIDDNWILEYSEKGKISKLKDWLFLVFGFPIFLVGCVHNLLPYLFIKSFVEKSFKRRVFWSGVKFLMGYLISFLINLPYLWLFYYLIYPSYWLALAYVIIATVSFGLIAYNYFFSAKNLFIKRKLTEKHLKYFSTLRKQVSTMITDLKLD
jgi:hypothetical protein